MQVYDTYKKFQSFAEFKSHSNRKTLDDALEIIYRIECLQDRGEILPKVYIDAAVLAVRIITVSEVSCDDISKYENNMKQIVSGEIAQTQPENKPLTITEPPKKYIPAEPKPKTRAACIKRGTSELKLEETLNTRILHAIREEPKKNPYKQKHAEYFKARIEEQKKGNKKE